MTPTRTWSTYAFEELVDLHDHRRIPLSKKERSARQGPYPYYGAQGVIDAVDDYIYDGKFLLIAEDGENLNSRKLPIAFFAEGQFWVNNHAHVVTARPGVADEDFLRVYVEFHPLNGHITGAAQPKLSQGSLKRLPVTVPSFDLQVRIGNAIRALDGLIENNRRRVEILEEMARLVFREWFVHFRFPNHENTELVDSHLGPIPDGWAVLPISAIADVVRGRSYRKHELVEQGGLPFVNLKCVGRGGGFRRGGMKRYDGPYRPEQLVSPGDIIVAVTDMTQARHVVGRAARVPALREPRGVISLDLVRVVPKRGAVPQFLFGCLGYSDFGHQIKEFANGTNVLHLSADRISEFEIVVPPADLQHGFAAVVGPMYELGDTLELQNEVLREARDLLLPRLVSGELDVSELDLELVEMG